jgi:RNA polymerase sigma factor (sigma-70 family)
MAHPSGSPLLAFIRRIAAARSHGDLTDGELLHRFAALREEAAFATLMQRHGPLVLGVCRTILRDVHDAEDAFQATFLVLARKPRSIRKPASLASWLHGVAYRLATKARVQAARRRVCERQAATMPNAEPQDEVIWRDLGLIIHEEVEQLPQRYRLPFVLCHLEGKTNQEAADLLGWPKGTVVSSLSRARQQLRTRLSRRGLGLASGMSAAFLANNVAQAVVPSALLESTLKAASLFATGSGLAGEIAVPVLASAEGFLHSLVMAKLKVAAAVLLGITIVATGTGLVIHRMRPVGHADSVAESQAPSSVSRAVAPLPIEKPVADELDGNWIVVAAEQYGRKIDDLNDRRLSFANGRFTLSAGRGEVRGIIPSGGMDGDFTVEPANPRRIDLERRNRHLRGVYELTRNELRICVAEADADSRPTDITTSPASSQLLLVLKRE